MFNPGDRVVRHSGWDNGGRIGIVKFSRQDGDNNYTYIVWEDDGREYGSYTSRLTLIERGLGYEEDFD